MRAIALIILIGLLMPFSAGAQIFGKKKKTESDSLRNGKCYEYWDKERTILSAKGFFHQGVPVKTWKYYYKDGTRSKKEKYRDNIKIKFYLDSGRLDKKGYAKIDYNIKYIHYYWQGRWKYYDQKRKLYRIALFEKGVEIKVLYGPPDAIYIE